jgi:Uma2 family endonuclease
MAMATAAVLEAPRVKPVAAPSTLHSVTIVTDRERLTVPAWVCDLESFRRWVHSDEVPEKARVHFFDGEVWVDMSKEQVFTHGRVKHKIAFALEALVEAGSLGAFFPDGLFLSNDAAKLACGPDGCFVSAATFAAGRIRRLAADHGVTELEGTPDMVLEIVSDSSVGKDMVVRRDLYWKAGIPEYWIVDARGEGVDFVVLKRGSKGYTAVRPKDGWLKSAVFGKSFRLTRSTDAFGDPTFRLETR